MDEESGSMYEPKAPEPAEKPDDKESADGATALLPKSVLKGKEAKVGDTHEFEIVRVYGDEVEVKCKGYSEKEESEEPEETEPSMSAKIDKMSLMNG